MILTENVFGNERFLMMMTVIITMMHFMRMGYLRMAVQCCFVAHDILF
jgi:hypothetical protein